MNRPDPETLLAFLEGRLDAEARDRLLDRLDADPALAAELRSAARGLEAVQGAAEAEPVPARREPSPTRGISPWWAVAASVATLALSVPATLQLSRPEPAGELEIPPGIPPSQEASFVLVLQGRWPDAAQVGPEETRRRAEEYWDWAGALAREGILMAAGDLQWEPGERLGAGGVRLAVDAGVLEEPDYLVGMYALRVDDYGEALAIARACPHLQYGGSVLVRQVGGGFVTVPGTGDWSQ